MAPPRRRQRMNARIFLRRGDAQGVSVQMLDKRGREVQIFFCNAQSKSSARSASQKKRHARTEAVCHNDDDFQRVPDVRDSFFFESCDSESSRGASLPNWKVFCESICTCLRMGRKGGNTSTFSCPDPKCSASFNGSKYTRADSTNIGIPEELKQF